MGAVLLSLTFDDIQITTATLAPLFDAIKDAFWQVKTPLLAILGLRLAIWVIPVLLKHVSKK